LIVEHSLWSILNVRKVSTTHPKQSLRKIIKLQQYSKDNTTEDQMIPLRLGR